MYSILRDSVLAFLVSKWGFFDSLITNTWTWWLVIIVHDPISTCSFSAMTRITSPPLGIWLYLFRASEIEIWTMHKDWLLGSNIGREHKTSGFSSIWVTKHIVQVIPKFLIYEYWSHRRGCLEIAMGSLGWASNSSKMKKGRKMRSDGPTTISSWIMDKELS